MAHVASSVFFSPFEKTNFISIDGFGDFASTVAGYYDGKNLNKSFEVLLFPHSLGIFIPRLRNIWVLNYCDEYKVMGLAPMGKLSFMIKSRI